MKWYNGWKKKREKCNPVVNNTNYVLTGNLKWKWLFWLKFWKQTWLKLHVNIIGQSCVLLFIIDNSSQVLSYISLLVIFFSQYMAIAVHYFTLWILLVELFPTMFYLCFKIVGIFPHWKKNGVSICSTGYYVGLIG